MNIDVSILYTAMIRNLEREIDESTKVLNPHGSYPQINHCLHMQELIILFNFSQQLQRNAMIISSMTHSVMIQYRLYKLNINCHLLTDIKHTSSKTDYGCSTIVHLRVEEQEVTLVNKMRTCVRTNQK